MSNKKSKTQVSKTKARQKLGQLGSKAAGMWNTAVQTMTSEKAIKTYKAVGLMAVGAAIGAATGIRFGK